jgi:iron complex transport system substrate-binding protein
VGGEQPVRYDDADGAPVEEIAALAPDLILATNSGITEKEYVKLSKIAPVVAYPEAPWVTPWQTSLETVGQALGRSQQAAQLADEAEARIRETREDYPQIEGSSLIFGYLSTADLSTVGFYLPGDPRVSFMLDLGFVTAPAVERLAKEGQFYGTVSAERASTLESDVLVTYAETEGDLATFRKDPLVGQVPALAEGHVYAEPDKHLGLAATNPTPLSIPVILDDFVPHVVKALDGQ